MKLKKSSFSNIASKAVRALIYSAAAITAVVMIFIVGYILVRGIPNITPSLFEWEYSTKNVSMLPSIINTVEITVFTLLLAVPLGVFAAIYLVEYSNQKSLVVKVIRVTTETLTGIPSIVYGLFGYFAFVLALGWGYSVAAGVVTLAIMVLPVIERTTEEALLSVPVSYREGSFGLGAGKLRTIFKIIVPSAMPGILSGVILAVGRIVGETAALIYTAGTGSGVASELTDSARTLSVHMYCLLSEGFYTEQAYATAVVLLIVVIGINALSETLAKKAFQRKIKEM